MKSLTKLVDSNMKFHGFFELWRDTTGAWSVFHFIYLSWMPRTTDAKIDQKHKKITFLNFFDFFHPFERKHTAERLFKFVKKTIFGVPSLEIWKNPWPVFISRLGDNFGGALVFSQMGGEYPPQAENFEDLRIWNAEFPYQKCILASQILKKFRLRRAIVMLVFLYKI